MPPGLAVTWAWTVTLAIFAALIAVDLIATRKPGRDGMRAAAVLSGLWVAAGLAFGGAVTASLWRDRARARRIDRIDRIDQPNEPVRE